MVNAIEIEIDGPRNERLYFRPLQRNIRGTFDMNKVPEPMARIAATEWPTPIPSQRLGIDPDGNGYLREPLHNPEHAALREKITRQGQSLEPAVQEFANIDLPSWLFWLKRAVDSGLAKLISGKLPLKIEGTPRTNYVTGDHATFGDDLQSTMRAQTAAFDRLAAAIEKLASK